MQDRPEHRRELDLHALAPLERLDMLRKQRVTKLICGGISDVLGKMLQVQGSLLSQE